MKAKYLYPFVALFAVMLVSCSDESEQLFPAVIEKMAAVNDSVLINSKAFSDGVRSLRPSTSQQTEDGSVLPDRKGEKGRDHREWYDMMFNDRFKNFGTDIIFSTGELYAIDPDDVNRYIFKFYFPEEFREKTELFEGLSIMVYIVDHSYGWYHYQCIFKAYPFQFGDSFTVARDLFQNRHSIEYYIYSDHPTTKCLFHRKIPFSDLVIMKRMQ